MTNEEKSNEISEYYATNRIFPNDGELAAYFAAMKMAKWKEQQMIDKACKFIAEWFYEHPHINMICSDEFESVDDLLKRFKTAMEE